MPKQPPEERRRNFDEVAIGYSQEQAMMEASRCLQCKNPSCVKGCPVEIDIPAFIRFIAKGKFEKAIEKIKEKNNLPAVCGRVCPQETQCEEACVLNRKGMAIAIGALERFAADYGLSKGIVSFENSKSTGKKVAIIGSGPAGLTAAGDLAKLGHEVIVFEALHKAGGVLTYGIPEFRLPKSIVEAEVDYIEKLGVKIFTNVIIGNTTTIDELFEMGYEAVFIGTGAGSPNFLGIPGENLNGVVSANEFLTRCNLMKAYLFPEYDTPISIGSKVVVVGGGNVAIDASRTALRLGAEEVNVVYRRSIDEMPARREEVLNAIEEGVEVKMLTSPVRVIGNKEGWIDKLECIRMRLGELDSSGRRKPIPIQGSNFLINASTAIIAIGRRPNPTIQKTTPGIRVDKNCLIIVDAKTCRTSRSRIWAGGDIVTGEATVISAMGAGKIAARDIHNFLVKYS
ncbi:MAG: NADPH-dependent glutamate synthase [Candidatus Bathyarchaeia archaeon]